MLTGIERRLRRALNPISTRVTLLVQLGPARARQVRRAGRAAAGRGADGWLPSRRSPVARVRRSGRRRASRVVVPDVVGLRLPDAVVALSECRLASRASDPDGRPLVGLGPVDLVVVAQEPAAGHLALRGSAVFLWVERGPGSAGVREPRRPSPDPRSARQALDEQTGRPTA